MKKCIGLFDSGAGGLSVLREMIPILPGARYIYYADNAHCPYGSKSREYILARSRAITRDLLGQGADIIVIACNTATAAAIRTLREDYAPGTGLAAEHSGGRLERVAFVGMEPAVKPAAFLTRTGVVGVLATAGTLGAEKYRTMRSYYAADCKIVEHVGQGFVELVENGILDGPEAEATVRESLEPLLAEGADVVVLGCTHYPFLLPVLRRVAGPGVTFIDPAPAVARQTARLLGPAPGDLPAEVILRASGAMEPLERIYRLIR